MRLPGEMAHRIHHGFCLGALVGALAGGATALGDFGAHWLWLESWTDRGGLLLRLLGLQVPAGALLGAALGAALDLSREAAQWLGARSGRQPERLRLGLLTLLASPGIVWLSHRLFEGGSMSRLPGRSLWQLLAGAALTAGLFAAIGVTRRLVCGASALPPQRRHRRALALLAAAFALGKLDQVFLPNLYDYLHGLLSLANWGLVALACLVLWLPPSEQRGRVRLVGTLAAPALAVLLAWTLTGLDQSQNVRVALMNANVSNGRSLLLASGSLLLPAAVEARDGQAVARARQAREARRAQQGAPPIAANQDGAHVLLITVDALRPDHLGSYGYSRPTSPQLDAFAAESVVFERAYCQAPHSSYSLSSLMTSEYLHETLDLGHPAPSQTLATRLEGAGYHTAAFYTQGIFHTAGERLQRYRDDFFGFALHEHRNRPAEDMTDRVLAEVDRTVERGEPSSLFWVHYFDVHEPYEATHFGQSDLDRYDSEIHRVDGAVARLIRETKRRLKRDVVVAITSDHGEEFRDHGGVYHGSTLYEEQVRVPLILQAPGLAPGRVSTPVEVVDLAPTLLASVGLPAAPSMRGRDLRPMASGLDQARGPIFSAVIHKKMVVDWPHKLIADLRFGLYELYDLEQDPAERHNLSDRHPGRLASLRGEIYAWLDSLAEVDSARQDPHLVALEWGRLGDRRAVQPLSDLINDEEASTSVRVEAAQILGRLADKLASGALLRAMGTTNSLVGAEAAIALGRMYDARARQSLRSLVHSEDPDLRSRAAVSLGRLRDPEAVPGLIDALWIAPSLYEREEAVRWLGRLGDNRALDPLINLLPEVRTRYLVVVAMGQIGDPRAYAPLTNVLRLEHHANIRDNAIRGLGLLGDDRAIELIVPLLSTDTTLKNAGESLVRLNAIGQDRIGGADIMEGTPGLSGWKQCHVGPEDHDWDYLHRTFCVTRRRRATLSLSVPASLAQAPEGVMALVSARRTDGATPAPLTITIGDQTLEPVSFDGKWSEVRMPLDSAKLNAGATEARIESDQDAAQFAVDHVLLVPRTQAQGNERGG